VPQKARVRNKNGNTERKQLRNIINCSCAVFSGVTKADISSTKRLEELLWLVDVDLCCSTFKELELLLADDCVGGRLSGSGNVN
jgi:hypothetical protein